MASSPSTPSADTRTRASALREALATRVVVADGAMGTMLQAQNPSLDDFQQLEGCNEVLNLTRPDIVRSVHEEYFAAGVDCVETNTFGANHSALGEYDIPERCIELSEAGARVARGVADEFAARDGRQRWVLGSMGPGTKLPTLGHPGTASCATPTSTTRRAWSPVARTPLMVETTQDLLQTKAIGAGCAAGAGCPGSERAADLLADRGDDRGDAAGFGDRCGADRVGAAGYRLIGLNCATGPAEMSEHLRYLARHCAYPLIVHAQRGPAGPARTARTFR